MRGKFFGGFLSAKICWKNFSGKLFFGKIFLETILLGKIFLGKNVLEKYFAEKNFLEKLLLGNKGLKINYTSPKFRGGEISIDL